MKNKIIAFALTFMLILGLALYFWAVLISLLFQIIGAFIITAVVVGFAWLLYRRLKRMFKAK